MLKPLVSIILPVYNRKKYLCKAIDSVLEQNYSNWELIIADDNSGQDTQVFLNKYTDIPKIKIYYNSLNLGLFANLNQAIGRCNGDYIIILCSDDFLLPHCLQTNLDLIEKYPEASLIISSTDSVSADGELLPNAKNFYYDQISQETKLLQPDESLPLLLKYGSINGNITGMFFKKNLYDRVGGFREDWRHAGDWEWIYRVARSSRVLLCRVNVAAIRIHQEQLSVINYKNLSGFIEKAKMVEILLADSYLSSLEPAKRWALNHMQFNLWSALKLALKGHWAESLVVTRAVHETTGFASTFWAMLKLLPQRWKVYQHKGFISPPD